MNEPQGVLRKLSPPSGGWERLLARRDAEPRWVQRWLPLAAGGVVTMLVLGTLVPQPRLEVSWQGVRGVGADVVPLDTQRIAPLPSEDPRVRLYWMEGASGAAAPREK